MKLYILRYQQHLSKVIPAIEVFLFLLFLKVERKFTIKPENWGNLKTRFTKLAIQEPKIIKLDDLY